MVDIRGASRRPRPGGSWSSLRKTSLVTVGKQTLVTWRVSKLSWESFELLTRDPGCYLWEGNQYLIQELSDVYYGWFGTNYLTVGISQGERPGSTPRACSAGGQERH